MNDLEKIFYSNKGGTIHKWKHYLEIYERHFSKYKNKEVVILEIGVFQGGSLRMWKKYFGKNAKIYGIDINPECKKLEEAGIEIFIGSQEDRNFLRKIKKIIPKVDILIEDGGHTMNQQITTFEELYDHVKSDGIYLCEDLHTSYWKDYGGGYKSRGTFIEYSKNFIDYLNAWHSK
jgi:23S rRNA U2552 (ribose-2'-O)-methylase RlmE/FtsJ